MKNFTLLLSICLSLVSFSALAHNGVDHSKGDSTKTVALTSSEAFNFARHVIRIGITSERLADSWKESENLSAETITVDDKQQWLVQFSNKAIDDVAQQILFVFLTEGGNYVNANFTGVPGDK